jgi:hypothetical protein
MIDNRVMDQHPCVVNMTPPPFKDPTRIATKIIEDDKELSHKMEMPPCGTGSESMTRHVHEFSSRVENLEISPENERACFALFRCSLTADSSSSAKMGWDEACNGNAITPLSKKLFIRLGKKWIARSAVERDRADQIPCLRTVTKGPNTTVEEFESNLLLCNQLADWLPGPTPALTADELKQTFFNAMPRSWTTKFRESGQLENLVAKQAVLACMRNCQKESNAKDNRRTCSNSNKEEILAMEDKAKDEVAIALDSFLEADNNKTSNLVTRPALFLWTVEMMIINVTNIQTNLIFGENAFFIQ